MPDGFLQRRRWYQRYLSDALVIMGKICSKNALKCHSNSSLIHACCQCRPQRDRDMAVH